MRLLALHGFRLYSEAVTEIRFGTDGWRGVIAEDFTFANASIVAHAIARYVVRGEDARKGMIVGYDHRYASDRIAAAVAEVSSASGTPVWLADKPCPTPTISFLVKHQNAAGGIVITASHNPYRWNGIKYKASYGSSALPSIVAQIEKELEVVLQKGVPPLPPQKELIHSLEPRAPYLEALEKLVDWKRLRGAKLRFIFDPMHGSAAGLLPELFRRNGIPCDEIRGTRDPRFGGVHPEPIEPHIEALRQAVVKGKYDAGFCADGDGDRIGAIDRSGAFVNPHQIFALLVWHLAGTRNLAGDIAKTFSVTKLIDKLAAKFGRKLHEVPIGFKYICELMLEQDILIGGEESGGIGTSLYLPERDATVSALFLAELMAWHGKSLGELLAALHAEFGEFHYGRVDLELRPSQKEKVIVHFADGRLSRILDLPIVRREDLDGIKLYLDETGWVMVRASGTENVLRIYSETAKAETTQRVLETVTQIVHNL
ncbi:MAG: phosphoglucosamine mutase [Acidobacteria bacterium]|nr:MAG: phosphoglucosamine mutase [Acidobacteriota bacterium]